MKLSDKQCRAIAESRNTKITLLSGAVSSGKTIASLFAFLHAVAAAPDNGLVIVVGRTLQTIERNIFDPLSDPTLFDQRIVRTIRHTTGSTTATILGRTVHLIGASDARSEGRIRGATVALALVDEATLVPQPFWMMLLSRLRVPGARLLATTNPDGPAHWLRKDFILRATEVNMAVFQFRLDDNPSLTEEYVRDLHAQYVGLWRRRFIDGEWCIAAGAVFDMFDPDRHTIGGTPHLLRLPAAGVDYGTTNPTTALMLGIQGPDPHTGRPPRLVLSREFRHAPREAQRRLTDAELSTALRAWLGQDRPDLVAVDPSAASFTEQLWRDGVPNVDRARNDVVDGIRMVASLLATDRLVIHESCAGLLDELPGYSWDPAAAQHGDDKPIKVDDHSCDAARYAICSSEDLWRPYLDLPAA